MATTKKELLKDVAALSANVTRLQSFYSPSGNKGHVFCFLSATETKMWTLCYANISIHGQTILMGEWKQVWHTWKVTRYFTEKIPTMNYHILCLKTTQIIKKMILKAVMQQLRWWGLSICSLYSVSDPSNQQPAHSYTQEACYISVKATWSSPHIGGGPAFSASSKRTEKHSGK